MKYIFQIPIFLLMLWASGVSYAMHSVALNDDIQAYVTKACGDGSATGAIDLQINDGTAEYEIYYYNAAGQLLNPDGAEDVNGLLPGTYHIVVVDSKCAKAEMDVIVGTFAPITITANINPICQVGAGSISPDVQGGSGEFSFVWSNGATSQNINNLSEGTFTVTVTDVGGCSEIRSFELKNVEAPFSFCENFTLQPPTSCSSLDGRIDAWKASCIIGGVTPFNYLWSTGATTGSISYVGSGTYTVTITDAAGCTGSKSQVLSADDQILHEFEIINPSCPGQLDGYIFLIPNQHVIYTCAELNINNHDTEESGPIEISDLAANTYCFDIVSKYGKCTLQKCYEIKEKVNDGPLLVTGIVTKSCPGEGTGSIELSFSGGYSKYSRPNTVWSHGGSNYGLSPGSYTVTVTDVCGQTATASFQMSDYDVQPIRITADPNFPPTGPPTNKESIIHTITGGSGNFKYFWHWDKYNNGLWTEHFHKGKDYVVPTITKYKFTVVDRVTGCQQSAIYDCIGVSAEIVNTCPGWEAGAIYIIPQYNKEGLKYNWSNGKTNQNILDLAKGNYSLTITNSAGCNQIKEFEVNDKNTVTSSPHFKLGTSSVTDECGWLESCNKKPNKLIEYDSNNPDHVKKAKNGITVGSITKSGCRKEIVTCPATGTTLERELPYKYLHDWDLCVTNRICPNNNLPDGTHEIGGHRRTYEIKNTWCTVTEKCVLHDPYTAKEVDHPSAYKTIEVCSSKPCLCCPKAITAKPHGKTVLYYIDYKEKNSIVGTIKIDQIIKNNDGTLSYDNKKSFDVNITGGWYTLSITNFKAGDYRIRLIQPEPCGTIETNFTIPNDVPDAKCATLKSVNPAHGNPESFYHLTFEVERFGGSSNWVGATHNIYKANSPNDVLFGNINPLETKQLTIEDGAKNLFHRPKQVGKYIGRVIIPNCNDIWYNIEVYLIAFKDCDKELFSITNNGDPNAFSVHWFTDNFVQGATFNKKDNFVHIQETYGLAISNQPMKDVRKDANGNHLTVMSLINEVRKYDPSGNLLWDASLEDFDIMNISDELNSSYDLVGFDNTKFKYISKTINADGRITGESELSIPIKYFDLLHKDGNTTMAFDKKLEKLIFSSSSGNVEKSVPAGLSVKDIKTLDNGNILVAGDFNGLVTFGGKTHDSNGFRNAMFLIYDKLGNLLSSKPILKPRHEIVQGIASNGNDKAAYHGTYQEIDETGSGFTDPCFFLDIIDIYECTTFNYTLTYDPHQCQLSWDEAPTGYTTMVQMEINGVWMPVQKAVGVDVAIVSPYTIIRDGKYRLVSSKDGCPDILSNEVNTSCTSGCACSIPNLVYDQTACTLTWTLTGCVGYTPSLQKLNSNNVWETIVQQATSPFNIITNGSYRLSVSKGMNTIGNACPTVLSNTVTTACTPSSNACSCAPATLSHNTASCSLSWTASSCTGYTTALQRNIASVWTTINASSPYTIPANSNGSYRIVRSKSGCTDLLSNVVNVTCSCSSPASITIFDYGTSGLGQNATILKGQSYTHEVSQGSPDACDESFIQLAFASSVVNSSWTFYVNGSVAVMPGTVIGSQYVVDLYLPTPPSGGTADVFMQSPCGDFYQLHLVYDCEPECVYIPCQSFFIDEFNLTNILLIENGNIAHNVSGYWNAADGCDHPNMTALSNQIKSSIISAYPSCDNASFNVFITWINDGFVIVLENSPMDIIQINANNFPPAFDTGICYPLNCECPAINISISGSINNSCENLTLNVTGGSAPYTYQISGTGSQSTTINQSGSSNVINLSGLLIGETITLSVTVTDQNGCTGDESITYLRCSTGCSGNTCSSQPAVCNGILNSSSGYNFDDVVNFLVPNGVSNVNIELAPLPAPQSLHVYNNGSPTNINVSNIFMLESPPSSYSTCQAQGINIFEYQNGSVIYPGGYRAGVYVSHPLSVNSGDILNIDISHPSCVVASSWYLRIICSGTGSKPVRNTFELENQVELEEIGVNGLSSVAKEERKSFRFFPNPFSKGINLELTSVITESLQLEVFNNLGLQVFTKTIDVQQGINLRYIEEFENVPSGVYTVKIKSDTKDHTSRVIKVE